MKKFWQIVWYNLTHITFKGRTSRKEFFKWFLFGLLVSLVYYVFVSLPASYFNPRLEQLSTVPSMLATFYLLFFSIIMQIFLLWKFLADISIIVRRFHDFGKSAWWSLGKYWAKAIGSVVLTYFIFAIIPGCPTIGLFVVFLLCIIFCLYYLGLALFKKGDEDENIFGLPPENL